MDNYRKLDMGDGLELYVETTEPYSGGLGIQAASKNDELVEDGQKVFDKALPTVKKFATMTKDALLKDAAPDELELSFSVGLSADLNAIITSAGGNTSFSVKMKWKKQNGDK